MTFSIMTSRKLSKQQKTILVALREFENRVQPWHTFHCLILTVTGVDTWQLERQNRDFHRYRGHDPDSCRKRKEGPRPIYDANRLKSNNAFATVSRSIARLAERGLVYWRVNKRNRRYPILTDEGKRVISEMCPMEGAQIAARAINVSKALNEAFKENERLLSEDLKTYFLAIKE